MRRSCRCLVSVMLNINTKFYLCSHLICNSSQACHGQWPYVPLSSMPKVLEQNQCLPDCSCQGLHVRWNLAKYRSKNRSQMLVARASTFWNWWPLLTWLIANCQLRRKVNWRPVAVAGSGQRQLLQGSLASGCALTALLMFAGSRFFGLAVTKALAGCGKITPWVGQPVEVGLSPSTCGKLSQILASLAVQ